MDEPISLSEGLSHIANLTKEMNWLEECFQIRANQILKKDCHDILPKAPNLVADNSFYGDFIRDRKLISYERMALAIALAPFLAPNIFNQLQNNPLVAQYAKLIRSSNQISLLPSGETVLFMLAGTDIEKRLLLQEILTADHFFYKESIIELGSTPTGEPEFLGHWTLSRQHREKFIHNQDLLPRMSPDFPADLITTKLDWEDLILAEITERNIQELRQHLVHYQAMVEQWGMLKHSRIGCRALFYGESGTGKTLVAGLLGKILNRQVFRIDLSLIISKYVGETSQHLRTLFNTAENKGWILFFDEGDALFSQRTNIHSDSPVSQYANQDTSFLLQRIESYNGIIIVATNFRSNIDQAFTRRFDHIIKFYPPENEKLLRLWRNVIPEQLRLDHKIDLSDINRQYNLSPAAVVQIVHRACLLTFVKGTKEISYDNLTLCIKDYDLQQKRMSRIST